MKTFGFIQAAISHHLKDPYSKALEPDHLSPPLDITTQPLAKKGEGWIRESKKGGTMTSLFKLDRHSHGIISSSTAVYVWRLFFHISFAL
jgi:hypothetical protein